MGFQVVLDDSDSTVSLVCTDNFQRPESSNFLSCLSSLDADHAFVLVQEALARRKRATQVRISGCHHHRPQSQLLMPHLASDLLVYLPSFLLPTLLLLLCCLASLTSSVFHCFSLLISSPSSQLLPSGEPSLCLLVLKLLYLKPSSLLIIACLCYFPPYSLQALKEELSARQDSINSLQHQHRQQEEKCKKLQQRLEQLEEESKMSSSQQQHLQSLVESLKR